MYSIISQENKQNIKCLTGCILSILALNMNLDIQEGSHWTILFLRSLRTVEIFHIILLPMLYHFYKHVSELYAQQRKTCSLLVCSIIPAGLFAFFMVMGYSFFMENSWELVFGNKLQLLKSLTAFCGYYVLFFYCIRWIFYHMDHLDIEHDGRTKVCPVFQWYLDCLRNHPFRTCFLTLMIVYLPYMIISYPGILGNDSRRQLLEGYNYVHGDGSGFQNQHPFVHTFLMTFFVTIGDHMFQSANIGLFLYSCFQAGLLFTAVSSAVKLLVELNYSSKYPILLMLYFVLTPRTQNYLFLAAKDACFASFLCLYMIQFYRVITGEYGKKHRQKQHLILLGLSALGVLFFRQDGIYLLLITFVAAIFLNKQNRKCWLLFGAGTFGVYLICQMAVLPGLGLTSSSKREMLSIPFQQTARYVKEAGDEVTEDERQAVTAILDYDNLGELYNPNLSDPVKSTFNEDATGEDMVAYFKVWFQMLLKRPDIYVQATMNNLYGYFYPDGHTANLYSYEKSTEKMAELNEVFDKAYGLHFSYPSAFDSIRTNYESFRENLYHLPVLSLLLSPAFYIWCLFLWFFYCIRYKNNEALLITVPPVTLLLIYMAGPTYGWYFRYLYSLTACLPMIILLGLHAVKSR